MIDPQALLKALRLHWALHQRHCKLLKAQQSALLACDREKFCALQPEHDLLVQQVQQQEEALRVLIQGGAGSAATLSAQLACLPERTRRPLQAVQSGLLRTLQETRALSERNAQLIQNELHYLDYTLDLFIDAGRAADAGYGGRGPMRGRLLLDSLA